MNINKMTTKVLSLVMVLALLLGVCAPTVMAAESGADTADKKNEKPLVYVSMGDSMTNGYGLEGYDGVSGIVNYAKDSYANKFAAWLAGYTGEIADDQVIFTGTNGTVDHRQLAMSGLRAEDLNWILQLDYKDAAKFENISFMYFQQQMFRNTPWEANFAWNSSVISYKDLWYTDGVVHTNGAGDMDGWGFKAGDKRTYDVFADGGYRYADGAAKILATYFGENGNGKGYYNSFLESDSRFSWYVDNAVNGLAANENYPEYNQNRWGNDNWDSSNEYGSNAKLGRYKYLQIATEFYQQSIKDADIISLALGNTNFGTYMLGDIRAVVAGDTTSFKNIYDLDMVYALADLEPEVEEEVRELILECQDYIDAQLIDLAGGDEEKLEALRYVVTYYILSYIVNYIDVVEYILSVNPDVEIIQVALMNAYSADEESDAATISSLADKIYGPMNAFLAALPTVMARNTMDENHLYEKATFYYAKAAEVDCLADEFGNDFYRDANGDCVEYDGFLDLNGTEGYVANKSVIRSRIFDFITAGGGLLDQAIAGVSALGMTASKAGVDVNFIAQYDMASKEAKLGSYEKDPEKVTATALYLAFERAIIAAGKQTVTLDSLSNMANAQATLQSIVGSVQAELAGFTNPAEMILALPTIFSDLMIANEDIMALFCIYARVDIGTGIGGHPNQDGHDELFEAVKTAYDEDLASLINRFETYIDLIKEYYDVAYAYGYAMAAELGIIDELVEYIGVAEEAIIDANNWVAENAEAENAEAFAAVAEIALVALDKIETLVNKEVIDEETYVIVDALIADLVGATDELLVVLDLALAETKAAAEEANKVLVNEMNNKIAELKAAAEAEKEAFKERAEARLEYLYELLKTSPEDAVAEIIAEIDLVKTTLAAHLSNIDRALDVDIDATMKFYAEAIAKLNNVTGGAVDALIAEYGADAEEIEAIAAKLYAEVYAIYGDEIDIIKAQAEEKLNELYEKLENCAEEAKAQILAEIEAVEADLDAAIAKKLAELDAAIAKINAEISAKLAILNAELVAQLTLLNDKVQQILTIARDIYDAVVQIKEDIEYTINVIETYVRALLAIDYEDLVAAVKALFKKYAPAVADNIANWFAANQSKIIDLLIACGDNIVDYFKANGDDILAFIGYVAEKFGEKADPIVEEILNNALTFDYTVSGESMILAIGGNYAVEYEEHYANVLAGLLKINGQTGVIATEGLRISDLLAILDADYDNDAYGDALLAELDVEALRELYVESIKASDLITVEFGVNDFTAFVVNQLLAKAIADHGETIQTLVDSLDMGVVLPELEVYELEWNRFGALADVVDIDAALAEIKAQLIAKGLPEYYETELDGDTIVIAVADYATYAIECFAYALTNYVYNYGAAIEAINAINPNAQIAVLGAINALKGISFEIEGTVINVGEYADYIVDALDAQTFLYALALPNTTYVPVQDAENYVAGAYGEVTYMDLIFVDFELVGEEDLAVVVKVNPEVLTPSAAGHAYIADQIYAAMNITCGHAYDWCLDETCNICGELRVAPGHVYSSPCDADCDVCGAIRSGVGHKYDHCYDAICNICGEERVITGHVYNNRCDAICNVCGFEREVEGHKYDNVCDEYCNTCGSKRETGGHKYTNACDVDCDICGTTRVPAAHEYDDCVDTTCNVCGKTRKAPGHTFGAWEIVKEATTTEAGEQKHTCKVCGATETEEIAKLTPAPVDPKPQPDPQPDPKTGLSGGAIAGIAVGSVAVVAVAAFAVFWFAVKKSTFAALGAAIKGLGAKIAGLFKKG